MFEVVTRCYQKLRETCPRITCSIKVDAREGASGRLESKVESVRQKLTAPVKVVEGVRE